MTERRPGHSKLVYNKATRTIDTVATHPETAPLTEAQFVALLKQEAKDIRMMGADGGCWDEIAKRLDYTADNFREIWKRQPR